MTLSSLRITLAQCNPIVGDIPFNLKLTRQVIRNTPDDTDLIIFPEMNLCGYSPEDIMLKPSFLTCAAQAVDQMILESHDHHKNILVSAPLAKNGKIYNAAYIIGNGQKKATILKHHLPNYGIFDEARYFSPGALSDPVFIKGHKIGIMICEDLWYPDIATHLKQQGAEMVISCNASPFHIHKHDMRMTMARQRVAETGLPLIYVNQCGGQDDLVFDGASFVLNEQGRLMVQAAHFAEDMHHTIWEKSPQGSHWLCNTEIINAIPDQNALIYQAAMTGLRDYVTKNGFSGILIGLSGGIDSALSAAIAVDALGKDMVHCVMMPSRYTSKESLEDAEQCAKMLGVAYDTIPIETIVTVFEDVMGSHFTPNTPSSVYENIQSRCRGMILMALSNASGKMVLSTGNKSEMAVGYATLYGDMCGGFNVLKDIYKTTVYDLAQWRNTHKPDHALGSANVVMPERIITKSPSAELRDHQIDQDSLPPYDLLDIILQGLIEEKNHPDDLIQKGYDHDIVYQIQRLLNQAEHKRRQSPPGVKITPMAFGRDRRVPITHHFPV